ncbi:MAG: NUDIX hydrolase [Gammaproteobacteria bacterium]|nr:NUDIX hydrolase [Gammaproteobacteria bacterium]
MTWSPHITVATIVPDGDRFLLVEEWADNRLVLNQPAGHLDPDESLIEAAVRETREETGWQIEVRSIVGIYLYKAVNGVTYHRTCFLADPVSQTSKALDHGIERIVWMTRAEVDANKNRLRSPMVTQCIDDYLAGQQFPLSMLR